MAPRHKLGGLNLCCPAIRGPFKRVSAICAVAAHNVLARSLWRSSLLLCALTPSISIMGCGVAREGQLQFICNRGVNKCGAQFAIAWTAS